MSDQEQKLKVCFEKEIHLIPFETSYTALIEKIQSSFGEKLPKDFKLFYVDFEGDLISITTQDDMEEALNFIKTSAFTIKIIIGESTEQARKSIVVGEFGQFNYNQKPTSTIRINDNTNVFQDSDGKRNNYVNELTDTKLLPVAGSEVVINEKDKVIKEFKSISPINDTIKLTQIIGGEKIIENESTEKVQKNKSPQDIVSEKKEASKQIIPQIDKNFSSKIENQPIFEIRHLNSQKLEEKENENKMINEIKEEEELYICFKCQGKGKNENGDNCPVCLGQGNLPNSWAEPLISMIQNEVSKAVQNVMKSEMQSLRESIRLEKSNIQAIEGPIHNNIRCNICKLIPIKGIRYKCPVCDDFDLCENCELAKGHQHALLKIRNPDPQVAPVKVISHNNKINPPDVILDPKQVVYKKEEEKIYFARFVKDDPKDLIELSPGQNFKKSWTLRNDGPLAWSSSSRIVMVGGDDLGGKEIEIGEVLPGMEKTITQYLTAPNHPGKYNQFFRISYKAEDGQFRRFGHRVWLDAIVKEEKANVHKEIPKENSFYRKKEESEDKVVEALKTLTTLNLEKKYEDNAISLIHMGILDVPFIIQSLKNNNNNVEAVTELFFNKEI